MSGQVSYGYDYTGNEIRAMSVDANGKLDVDVELNSIGLATSANQTNGDQKAKCMGGETDGTQQQILVSNLGVVQTLDSEVFGKTSQIANQTTLSNTNEATIIANQTNGTQVAKCMGNFGGSNVQLKVDANGVLETSGGGGGGGGTQYDMGDALGATPTGTVALGRDGSGNAQALQVSVSGNQFVELADFTKGQYNMANSLPVVIASDQSTIDVQTLRDADSTVISTTPVLANGTFTSPSIDMNGFSQLMIIGNTTNLTDQMDWYYSFDDATFFKGSQVLYDFLNGDFAEQPAAGVGARYIRVAQTDSTASNFTVQFASSKR